eukprot:scaffold211891_cov24-Tisochrysis_lutea.AAC.3
MGSRRHSRSDWPALTEGPAPEGMPPPAACVVGARRLRAVPRRRCALSCRRLNAKWRVVSDVSSLPLRELRSSTATRAAVAVAAEPGPVCTWPVAPGFVTPREPSSVPPPKIRDAPLAPKAVV